MIDGLSDASTGLLPIHHSLRDLTILDRGVFVHLDLSRATPEEVLDCSNVAGGQQGCLRVECVANVKRELGLGSQWFRPHHPKCTGWKYKPEKRGRWEYSPSVQCEDLPLQPRFSGHVCLGKTTGLGFSGPDRRTPRHRRLRARNWIVPTDFAMIRGRVGTSARPWHATAVRNASASAISGTSNPAEYCKHLVRKYDYEGYLVSQLYPRQHQSAFYALRAFYVRALTSDY